MLAALPLLACTPAGDKAETGEAIAEGTGLGNSPTGRVGDPVDSRVGNAAIPANIDEGIENWGTATQSRRNEEAGRPSIIPARFQGRWGLVAADCDGGAAAKGLLTIEDRRLVFYESRAELDRVDAWQSANRFTANYRFSGEGQNWQRVETLTVQGRKLERRSTPTADQTEPVESLTYTACPA